jgi:hypothetical protein
MDATYPHWLPDPQQYAVDQERFRHDQAVYDIGEYSMFILLWNIDDFEAGRVTQCSRCVLTNDVIGEVYAQPATAKCPVCYGTTFEGGIRARIVRPTIWATNEFTDRSDPDGQGIIKIQKVTIQSISDFRLRTGDFIFRGDGTRWQMKELGSEYLRTGFATPTVDPTRSQLGYNYGDVNREDESSVAFIIPPDETDLKTILNKPFSRYPADFSGDEQINGALQI